MDLSAFALANPAARSAERTFAVSVFTPGSPSLPLPLPLPLPFPETPLAFECFSLPPFSADPSLAAAPSDPSRFSRCCVNRELFNTSAPPSLPLPSIEGEFSLWLSFSISRSESMSSPMPRVSERFRYRRYF